MSISLDVVLYLSKYSEVISASAVHDKIPFLSTPLWKSRSMIEFVSLGITRVKFYKWHMIVFDHWASSYVVTSYNANDRNNRIHMKLFPGWPLVSETKKKMFIPSLKFYYEYKPNFSCTNLCSVSQYRQ